MPPHGLRTTYDNQLTVRLFIHSELTIPVPRPPPYVVALLLRTLMLIGGEIERRLTGCMQTAKLGNLIIRENPFTPGTTGNNCALFFLSSFFSIFRLPRRALVSLLRGDLHLRHRLDLAVLVRHGVDDHGDRIHAGHPRHRHGAHIHRSRGQRAGRPLRDRRRQRRQEEFF